MLGWALSGFALAALAPWIHRVAGRAACWLLALLPAALTVRFLLALVGASRGIVDKQSVAWLPERGVHLAFSSDGLGALFAVVISLVGTVVMVYSGGYLQGHARQGRFYSFILAFMASMLGVALADNLLVLFVFWELTSFTSYFLIGFDHEKEEARKAAWQAILVTSGGGLALLAGIILLGQAAGTFSLSELARHGALLRQSELYLPILALILGGAFTKSAQFPFHFWLPNAMEAPTPVSTYLHSATMVKVGIYLLARLSPALSGTEAWFWSLSVAGGITMVLGAWLAFLQDDLKRMLAYATLSVLGTLVLLLALDSRAATKAAIVLLLAHAAYKGALFFVVGALDHETGTRELSQLSGLRRAMPLTATAGLLAALSMVGVPPFAGYLSKELLYAALPAQANMGGLLLGASVIAKALLVASAAKAVAGPFFGPYQSPREPHEAPLSMWFPPLLLAGLGLAALVPVPFWSKGVGAAVHSMTEPLTPEAPTPVDLSLWHGLSLPLVLSFVTFAGGAVLFFFRDTLLRLVRPLTYLGTLGPDRAYRAGLGGLQSFAQLQTRVLQTGYLRYYVSILAGSAAALMTAAFLHGSVALPEPIHIAHPRFHELIVALIVVLAAFTSTLARSRLTAVAALGAVGFGVSLLFVLFGAPDLAITQVSIETLTVVLFLSVVYRLPPFVQFSTSKVSRVRDVLIAASLGVAVSLFLMSVNSSPASSRVSSWFADNGYVLAHGRNIVNVILVDFRALDTLGELTVLAMGAIGVAALMKLRMEGNRR